MLLKVIDKNIEQFHEAGLLKLNCDKALKHLKWKSTLNFYQTVQFTTEWYKNYYSPSSSKIITEEQIYKYIEISDNIKISTNHSFMTNIDLNSIVIEKLKKIATPGGDIMHFLKSSSNGYRKFGEVYFSWINENAIKAWKKHNKMTLNLVVPIGKVKFVFHDNKKPKYLKK